MSGQSCDKASGAMRKTEADFFSALPRLLPKIHALAAQYSGSTDDFDDLVQEGMIALFQKHRPCSTRRAASRLMRSHSYASRED